MGVNNAWAWWFVPGSWNGWDSNEANSGGVAQMNSSNTITFYNVPAGNYEMKLIKGSTWGNGNYTNKSGSYISSVSKATKNGNDEIKLSKACDLTFTITDENNWKCDVSASDPTHYIKYNWNGSGWAWSGALTAGNNYSCTGQYGESTSFDHTRKSSTDESGTNATGTTVNSPTTGDKCVFTYNTSTKALTITRCNKVTANSKIYFDNSLTNWSNSNIYFVVGHDKPTAYSKVYKMNAVNNTKLFYAEISDTWEDATYYAFVGVDNEWNNGEWGSSNLTSATKYTKAYTAKYDLGTNGCYYITPSTGNNNTAFTITYKESYNNIPKLTATQSAKIRNSITDQKYTIVTGTWPATLKLEGTHLTGFGKDKSARITISSTTSGSNVVYEAVVTGKITHSYTNIGSYVFDGWGTSTTPSNTSSTYDYNITAATTVYAFFTKAVTMTFTPKGEYGSSTVSGTATGSNSITKSITSGAKVAVGSTINLTANPATGYQVEGWYSDANCTNQLQNGGNTYSAGTLTAAKTVYVKFEETKYDVTIQAGANGSVSPSGVQKVGNITPVNIEAIANDECEFVNWTKTGNITITKANNSATTIKATGTGTVTANFRKIEYTTVYLKPGAWSSDAARFAVYAYVDNDNYDWYDMTPVGCSKEYYQCNISKKYTNVIFCRMNPSKPANNWDNKWNQTSNLSVSANKIWTFTEWDNNSDGKDEGTWAAYNPTVTLTLKSSSNGTYKITYEGKTYESSLTEDVVIPNLPLDAKIIISESATPNAGYWLKERFIKLGTNAKVGATTNTPYTLCGSTTISANFVTIQPHTVYLNITDHNWASDNAKLAIYVYDEADEEGAGTWIALTQVGSSKYYTATIPKNESNFNFVRLKNNSTLNWSNKWNQTGNLAIPVTRYNTFKLTSFGSDGIDAEGKWGVGTAYSGDYRLAYVEQVVAKGEGADNWKTVINDTDPSHTPDDIIRKRANGRDTISLFINIDGDNPEIILQQYNGSQWVDKEAHMVNGPLEADASKAMLPGRHNASPESGIDDFVYDDGIDAITESGVWNFVIVQDAEGNASLLLKEDGNDVTHKYTGNYYIRTNNAAGGWNKYTHPDNIMSRSTYSESGYTHYYCKWVEIAQNPNVKFIVATDYCINVSKEFAKDNYTSTDGVLVENANVRWSWDENTGVVARAYIQGAYNPSTHARLENIVLNYTTDGENNPDDVTLDDNGDWIYSKDITVNSGATLESLTAAYPSGTIDGVSQQTQTFAEEKTMLEGEGEGYTVRVLYDFKENKTMIWLLPNKEAETGIDVLIERVNQNEATQVAAAGVVAAENEGETGFTVYAAISFEKVFVNDGTKSKDLRQFYWISFPFNVDMKDVFGFGEYGTHWILEYYDGERRAKDGLWLDSPSFWEYIIDTTNFVIEANKGYVLCLDLETMGVNSEVFQNTDKVTLYFPSKEKLTTINQNYTMTQVEVPSHIRTNTRANRHIYDSNWNLIGVPSYANKDFTSSPTNLQYFYEYNPKDDPNQSDYTTKSSTNANFNSMYAYFVQWGGTINWETLQGENTTPQEMKAKKNADYEAKEHNLRLELQHNGAYTDQTFVALKEEGATAAFDLNLDLTKISGTCSGIYTLAGEENIQLAGNVLPLEDNTIIPVGVQVAKAGEYTFAMPDGTDGIVVELIDYETNTRTNMLLDEYTVNLGKGTFESRFALHVRPDKTVTSLDNIGDETTGDEAKKYIIDGKLFLQKDNTLYDAQGHIVR